MGDITYYTDDNLELRIIRTNDGMYHMTVSKDYVTGTKDELLKDVSSDFNHLIQEFEQLKLKRSNENER